MKNKIVLEIEHTDKNDFLNHLLGNITPLPRKKREPQRPIVFFEDHPTVGNSYKFKNILTGETVTRTVTTRVKKRRGREMYFEATMTTDDGRSVVAEYEVDKIIS